MRASGFSSLVQAVENEELLAVLTELGVAGFQGYAAARPQPLPPASFG